MATCQQLWIVVLHAWFLHNGTNEDVMELEPWTQVYLTRQLTLSLELISDYLPQLRKFGYRIRASLNRDLQRGILTELVHSAVLSDKLFSQVH
jgi:hypothetical protein